MKKSLLIIDDETLILETVEMLFSDFAVTKCGNAADGLAAFEKERPDVVLSDIKLPDLSGLELFEKLHAIDGQVPVILMTGQGRSGTAIEALQKGAFEYVLKPLDPDTLVLLVESAYESSRMMRVSTSLPDDTDAEREGDSLIGDCEAMQDVYRSIGRVASQNVTVLILGESGTGKEVIARAIFNYSQRAKKNFLAINCAAIPDQLLESELFGHEKGSFTGADRKRIGKFEQCSKGTLFLDEIGDMPSLMQTKILRVLQDQTFERVGGSEVIQTDVRLIAATNRDLESMIEKGDFRSDLFYRLNIYTINLPPLRERGNDIILLAEHFRREYAKELGKEIKGIAPATIELLKRYHWPGNVRELQSVIKHTLLQATGPVLVPAFLPEFMQHGSDSPASVGSESSASAVGSSSDTTEPIPESGSETLDQIIDRHCWADCENLYVSVIEEVERRLISRVLHECGGNQAEAARRLGVTRSTIRAKITKLEIGIHTLVD